LPSGLRCHLKIVAKRVLKKKKKKKKKNTFKTEKKEIEEGEK